MTPPYYIIPDIEALPEAKGEDRLRLCRRIAALVGDPIALRAIIGIDPAEFAEFYPDMIKPDLSTDDTISSFLDKYGDKEAPISEEVMEIDEPVPLPPADYDLAEIIADPIGGETDVDDSTSSLLDSFLGKKEPQKPVLSESLARAMIKNGNYAKALEIITELSLNNPKKSIYFADQIRFLKKLILNQSISQQS